MAKTPETSHIVRLQLTCVTPPQNSFDPVEVEFGLQDRSQILATGQCQPDGSFQYEIEVAAIPQRETQEVRWRGPYVHGTPVAPFLYLSLKRRNADPISWIRRLKVPLPHLAWEQIGAVQDTPCFAATVSGEGSGTVPLLGEGWIRQSHFPVKP